MRGSIQVNSKIYYGYIVIILLNIFSTSSPFGSSSRPRRIGSNSVGIVASRIPRRRFPTAVRLISSKCQRLRSRMAHCRKWWSVRPQERARLRANSYFGVWRADGWTHGRLLQPPIRSELPICWANPFIDLTQSIDCLLTRAGRRYSWIDPYRQPLLLRAVPVFDRKGLLAPRQIQLGSPAFETIGFRSSSGTERHCLKKERSLRRKAATSIAGMRSTAVSASPAFAYAHVTARRSRAPWGSVCVDADLAAEADGAANNARRRPRRSVEHL